MVSQLPRTQSQDALLRHGPQSHVGLFSTRPSLLSSQPGHLGLRAIKLKWPREEGDGKGLVAKSRKTLLQFA